MPGTTCGSPGSVVLRTAVACTPAGYRSRQSTSDVSRGACLLPICRSAPAVVRPWLCVACLLLSAARLRLRNAGLLLCSSVGLSSGCLYAVPCVLPVVLCSACAPGCGSLRLRHAFSPGCGSIAVTSCLPLPLLCSVFLCPVSAVRSYPVICLRSLRDFPQAHPPACTGGGLVVRVTALQAGSSGGPAPSTGAPGRSGCTGEARSCSAGCTGKARPCLARARVG